jgi:hypothetical protein
MYRHCTRRTFEPAGSLTTKPDVSVHTKHKAKTTHSRMSDMVTSDPTGRAGLLGWAPSKPLAMLSSMQQNESGRIEQKLKRITKTWYVQVVLCLCL